MGLLRIAARHGHNVICQELVHRRKNCKPRLKPAPLPIKANKRLCKGYREHKQYRPVGACQRRGIAAPALLQIDLPLGLADETVAQRARLRLQSVCGDLSHVYSEGRGNQHRPVRGAWEIMDRHTNCAAADREVAGGDSRAVKRLKIPLGRCLVLLLHSDP